MSVKFSLDRALYYPGDTVAGNLTYQVSKQRTIKQAILIFNGTLRTEYVPHQQNNSLVLVQGPRRPSKETYVLFQYVLKLFEGPYDVPPQTFEYPFQFDIPECCDIQRTVWNDGGEQPSQGSDRVVFGTPPTYAWRDLGISREASADITYKLVFKSENSGLFKDDEQMHALILRQHGDPSREPHLKPTRHELPRALWSSDKLRPAERRLSFKQKMRSTFSSNPELKPPTLAFNPCVYVPKVLSVDQQFGVGLSVEQQKIGENDPEKPSLVLERLFLKLKSHTTVAVESRGLFRKDPMLCQGEAILASHEVSVPEGGIQLSLGGQLVDIAANLNLCRWQKSETDVLIGDFRGGVMRLEHRLAIELLIRHVETGKDFRLATQVPIEVLNTTTTDHGGAKSSSSAAAAKNDYDLPAYQPEDQPPGMESMAPKDEAR